MVAVRIKACSKRPGWFLVAVTIITLASMTSLPAWSQTWNGSVNNQWNNAGNWTPNSVPNSSGATVDILNGANSPVTVSGISPTIGTLNVGSSSSLDLGLGIQFFVSGGSISNAGAMTVSAGFGNNTFLQLGASTTLSGAGTLTLNSGDNDGQAIIQQNAGGVTLTNQSTIQGYGIIGNGGLAVNNQSLIDANVSGLTLTLNSSGGVTNTGTLEATGGGTLNINAIGVNNTGGTILSSGSGSNVLINGSTTIAGGTLTSTGGGVLGNGSGGVAYLNGSSAAGALTLSTGSTWTGGLGSQTFLNGSIINQGNFQVNAGSGNNTFLQLNANTALTGGGTVTLNSGDNNGQAFIQQSVGGVTLTNVNNTIQGYGVIGNSGLTVINQATIDANVSGKTLTLNSSGGVTNTATLEATGGGTLNISAIAVNNAGGAILSSGSGSNVLINGSTTIEGGALTSIGGGVLGNGSGGVAYLNGSSAAGALTLSTGSTWTGGLGSQTFLNGSIINQGNFQVNAGSGNNTFLQLNANTALTGGGTVTLNSGNNNGQAIVQQSAGGVTLTNVNNTIQGYGIIGNGGLTVVNENVIDANVSGQTLTLNSSGGVTNTATLEATGGGTLNISAIGVNNAGGTILSSGSGSNVLINGSTTIEGGTLTSTGGGALGDGGGVAYLNGSSAAGALTLSTGSTWTGGLGSQTFLNGSIINQGNFQVNAGSGNNTFVQLNANTTLTGGGTVTLNSGNNNGQAIVQQSAGGVTLTNVNNTIQGYGIIGNGGLTVVNENVIDANVSGQTLTLNSSGGVTNTATLEATGGGTLNISAIGVNNAGGTILSSGSGSNVLINGSTTIEGGTLTSTGGGALGDGGGVAYLNGSSAAGALTLSTGSTWTGGLGSQTFLNGSIINQGNFQVNAGSGNNTFVQLNANTTLSGGGTVTLNSGNNNGQAFIQQTVGGVTLTNSNNTIQGYGVIGNGGLTVINGTNGTILANAVGQTLLVSASGGLTNNGTLQANAGSTLVVSSPLSNFAGTTLTDGTYNGNGGTIQLNLASNTSGGEIVTDAANIVLNGTTAAINDLGNHNALSDLATIAASNGSLSLLNGAQLSTSAANFTNNGRLTIGAGSALNVSSGNFAQGATGTLDEQVAGTGAGQFGVTDVSGAATLAAGSTLDVTFLNGFDAGTGDDYIITFLDATGGLTGTYSNVDFTCPIDDTCSLGYTADTAYLGIDGPPEQLPPVIPEPSTFVMMASGIASFAAGIKMRKGRRSTSV